MASTIHVLNPPPHPFWDFVANIEDHPLFAAYAGPPTGTGRFRQNVPNSEQQQEPAQSKETSPRKSEEAAGKQPTVEDEISAAGPSGVAEADPGNHPEQVPQDFRGMPFRGRGRFAPREGEEERGGACRPGGMHGRGGHGGSHGCGSQSHGPPPMGGPWWARRGPAPPGFGPGPHHHHGPPHGPSHHHHHHGLHGRRPHSPPLHRGPRGGPGNFNLSEFLNNLGGRLGIDLSGAAEGLGLGPERFNTGTRNTDANFEPRADVFDTPSNYTIHLSLPGAKKEDLGVEWDGESSVLHIGGVVYRPGADEELLKHLVVDGRKREVGVFEKNIRLGTKSDPASVDVAGINAKMIDGVLVVMVPKVAIEHKKREVPVNGSSSSSPTREADMEKGTLIDTDEMYDDPAVSVPNVEKENGRSAMEKEAESQRENEMRAETRSETMDFEHEDLPEYEAEEEHKHEHEHKHENDASDEEGEYVKISVD